MGQYPYQSISSETPEIPILTVNLFLPGDIHSPKISCVSILDTGSDCTLLPITLLMQARASTIAMLQENLDLNLIVKTTGLSLKAIEKLKKEHNL
ncbi:MAG: hypothetical protein HC860_05470 [Alkalinema sp. RU_4_3]|nr:hypothetical protein [Alkalinema sp. RU_4_3]